MDHDEFSPWPFLLGAAIAAYLFAPPRDTATDLAVLRDARAVRAVSQQYGYVTPEQAQVLYRAGEIEAKVDGWRRYNDARQWRWATTTSAWIVGLLVLLALAKLPGDNVLLAWVGGIGTGVATFQYVEPHRRRLIGDRPVVTGRHSHGSGPTHVHPHTRRHRHYGDLDGPWY